MEVISSRDMQILDLNCEFFGLSRLQLMENAGRGVAEEVLKAGGEKVTIFAGPGNNGGDGFVAARHLMRHGVDVEVALVGRRRDVRSEIARRNLEIIDACGIVAEVTGADDFDSYADSDVIVDAMLGTGVRGKLKEPISSAVDFINERRCLKVAVDVPTGMDPDTGEGERVVKADITVTFHKPKPGLLKSDLAGKVVVKDIGIPPLLERMCGVGDVRFCYRRMASAHKGMHGRVLVVGGGEYTGAPALTALAAYASGADIVTLAVPESIRRIVASYSPNLIVRGLKGDRIGMQNLDEIASLAAKHDVIVAGMGVGKGNEEFQEVICELAKSGGKFVLDAEGITPDVSGNVILTPHRGEFERAFGKKCDDIGELRRVAEKTGVTIILKGREDWISDGERVKVNRSGNAGMTVGGTGDVLAGICAALFCNDDSFHSACAAAFVNGYCGDLCYEKYGFNYTATDLVRELPAAFKRCLEFG